MNIQDKAISAGVCSGLLTGVITTLLSGGDPWIGLAYGFSASLAAVMDVGADYFLGKQYPDSKANSFEYQTAKSFTMIALTSQVILPLLAPLYGVARRINLMGSFLLSVGTNLLCRSQGWTNSAGIYTLLPHRFVWLYPFLNGGVPPVVLP